MAILKSQLLLSLIDRASGPLRAVGAQLSAFQANQRRVMAPMRGVTGGLLAFGAGYLGVTAGINSTIGAALKFEDAFADVRKVINANEGQFATIRQEIINMSKTLPIAASGIAEIYAAAGQADIPMAELTKFTEMVAKVGVAWDVPVGETGQALAEIKAQLQMSVSDLGLYADAINHLSNTTAARAPDLVDFSKRVAGTGEMYGFTATQTLAFGSAMVSVGAQSEVAATSFRNMGRALTIGGRATKMQRNAFNRLGLDSVRTAKAMQKDALKTTLSVIEKIQALPEWERISIASALFGDEARALMPLINNSTELRRQLGLVAKETDYAGSAFKEYVVRASTVGNVLAILRNKVADVFRGLGDDMLPWLKEAALGVGDVIDSLGQRATIFDRMGSAVRGFMDGFGANGSVRQLMNDLGDLLFGEADGSAAADRLGQIFVKFQRWGGYVREFTTAIADNPIAKFFASMAGYGFEVMLWVAGFSLLAGAIMKLGRAMMFLSGASAAIGILKSLSKIGGGLVGWEMGVPPRSPAVPAPAPTKGGVSPFLAVLREAGKKLLTSSGGLASLAAILTATVFENLPPADPSLIDSARGPQRDTYNRLFHGVPFEGGMHRLGRETSDLPPGQQTINPLPQSKGELPEIIKTQPIGVTDVNVTNPIRPNMPVYVTVHNTQAMDPDAIGWAVGRHVKAAVEASFSEGGL